MSAGADRGQDLETAERAWRAAPADVEAGARFLSLAHALGVEPPLDLLERRTLPGRTIDLPGDGLSHVRYSTADGRSVQVLGGGFAFAVEAPQPPGPIVLPPHTALWVTFARSSTRERLSALLSRVLTAAAGERLKLEFAEGEDLDGVDPDVGPVPLESLALAPSTTPSSPGLRALRVGAFRAKSVTRPAGVPQVTWGLEVEHRGAIPLEQVARQAPGLRAFSAELDPDTAAVLPRWPRLERLRLERERWDEEAGLLLSRSPRLRQLILSFAHLERGFLDALADGPARLESLSLLGHGCVEQRDRKLYRELGRLTSLRRLCVSDMDSTSVKGWERLDRIEELVIDCHPPITLNAVAWRTIGGLPRLRVLSTDSCGLGDFTIGQVAASRSIEALHCHDEFALTDKGLAALHGHPSLRHVVLLDTRTTAEGRAKLAAALGPGAYVA